MNVALLAMQLQSELDVVPARQRARHLAEMLGFSGQLQTAIATAVSEIARNALTYGGGWAKVDFAIADRAVGPCFRIVVEDRGKGIADLDHVLSGQYQSKTGMGLGIVGSRRLCDEFEITSTPEQGTRVTLAMRLPRPISISQIASITEKLARSVVPSPMDEVLQQNRELMASLEALMARQAEVDRLNAELSETNRGVLALYAELDEQAAILRRNNESKSRFLSDITHELRTPLSAMISLAGLLLDRTDGELNEEQEKQVAFIRTSANSLGEMVNDLLDLAKIESGKIDIRAEPFSVTEILATLRGMFRPLFANVAVNLVIEEPSPHWIMISDEQKLSQILRNFVSNALKFTEAGEVRVRATLAKDDMIEFAVSDTGIGIDAADLETVFLDFAQLDGSLQRRQKGTGLGLPLTRKLATLLGGTVKVVSSPGRGSTFTIALPMTYQPLAHGTPQSPSDQLQPDDVPSTWQEMQHG